MIIFDVFINGIQKKRLDESEKIKQEIAKYLKISNQQVEELLASSFGSRIFRSVSEQEALQHQKNIQALGAICVYRPGTQLNKLSLAPPPRKKKKKALKNALTADMNLPLRKIKIHRINAINVVFRYKNF